MVTYKNSSGNTFCFNAPVHCVTLSLIKGAPVIGRLVQVREAQGAFGTEIYFLRMPDGTLQTVQNELIQHYHNELPLGPDTITSTYTINQEFPETGFIIPQPTLKQ